MDVTTDVVLTSLAVRVSIAHAAVGDLRLRLRGPNNRTLTLPHAGLNGRLTGVTDAAQIIPGSLI